LAKQSCQSAFVAAFLTAAEAGYSFLSKKSTKACKGGAKIQLNHIISRKIEV